MEADRLFMPLELLLDKFIRVAEPGIVGFLGSCLVRVPCPGCPTRSSPFIVGLGRGQWGAGILTALGAEIKYFPSES